jgi:hypothetical protein
MTDEADERHGVFRSVLPVSASAAGSRTAAASEGVEGRLRAPATSVTLDGESFGDLSRVAHEQIDQGGCGEHDDGADGHLRHHGQSAAHGLPVSGRVMGTVQLVVSALVNNPRKYALGPYMLTLKVSGGAVAVTVWDSEPTLPIARAADPGRVGQH